MPCTGEGASLTHPRGKSAIFGPESAIVVKAMAGRRERESRSEHEMRWRRGRISKKYRPIGVRGVQGVF
jgi:hypothetical protein